ncbi:MAG: hypothetical protein QOE41_2602 [Mycobacterium sp.]|jgi:hypothetical protein|nr:hypothetical protein [Mycobacterium sp.]MDT5133291.1 hypothetical protein [Mycobacterium sp.]
MGVKRITISCRQLLDIADRLADAAEALDDIRPIVTGPDQFPAGGASKFNGFMRELNEWELAFRAAAHDSVTEPPADDRVE